MAMDGDPLAGISDLIEGLGNLLAKVTGVNGFQGKVINCTKLLICTIIGRQRRKVNSDVGQGG
jgi:hypothetical protein